MPSVFPVRIAPSSRTCSRTWRKTAPFGAAEAAGYLGAFLRDGDLLLVKGDRDRSDFGDIPELLQKL